MAIDLLRKKKIGTE